MKVQNVYTFTDEPLIAYLKNHTKHRLMQNNQKCLPARKCQRQLQELLEIHIREQPFLRCKSIFQSRLCIHFKRPSTFRQISV